ncbi:TetR family transcriptional regulator, partial [Mesorhizobium sp. M2D.F.Ca.ET.145.01.1.1]
AIFTNLARATRHPKWKGCGFLRTAAELASMPGHPAVEVGARHKSNFETWLATELSGDDIEGPQALAREIVLLIDGCFSIMLIHRNPDYVEAAGRA